MTAEISVLMGVRNGGPHVTAAARSILGQADVDLQLWVMDDGSTDDTFARLQALAAQDSRLVVCQQPNQGLGAALNALFSRSRSPLVARIDADDLSFPWRIAEQRAYLDAHPGVGVVSTWSLRISSSGMPFFCECPPDDDRWIKGMLQRGWNPIIHPTVLIRRAVLEKLEGPYRFRLCQDFDLWLRLIPLTRFGVVERVCHAKRVHAGQAQAAHLQRNKRLIDLILELHRRREAGQPEGSFVEQERAILGGSGDSSTDVTYDEAYFEGMAALLNGRRGEACRRFDQVSRENPALRWRALRWRAIAMVPGLHRMVGRMMHWRDPLARYRRPLDRACAPEERGQLQRLWQAATTGP